jgi:hypothetical protein
MSTVTTATESPLSRASKAVMMSWAVLHDRITPNRNVMVELDIKFGWICIVVVVM